MKSGLIRPIIATDQQREEPFKTDQHCVPGLDSASGTREIFEKLCLVVISMKTHDWTGVWLVLDPTGRQLCLSTKRKLRLKSTSREFSTNVNLCRRQLFLTFEIYKP